MSAFDNLPRCSFDGFVFPYESIEIVGGVRDHVHEYSHSDGGDPELLGRKLYTFRIVANFHDTFRAYPGLYPDTLHFLLRSWEVGVIGELVVPQQGTFQAYAINWSRSISTKIRSGEKVTLEFREAPDANPLYRLSEDDPVEVQSAALKLDTRVKEAGVQGDSLSAAQKDTAITAGDRDLFDSIRSVANSVFAIQDTAALNGQLYSAKLAELAAICERADGLRSMQTTSSQPIVQALHDLWFAALRVGDKFQGKRGTLQRYTTPQRMTMNEVAIALYRDATKTSDLLALNAGNYQDALAIPAGTDLVYYPVN